LKIHEDSHVRLPPTILIAQFEAALCMLDECVRRCPPEHFDGKIGNDTFRQVAYHTLFYADFYLSPGEAAFALRELHARGGDERGWRCGRSWTKTNYAFCPWSENAS
jgi:hypothetical protein